MSLEINIPAVVAEVSKAHDRYEKALGSNDLDVLDSLFWASPLTLRYGPNGTLVGHAAISAFRRARNIKGVERTIVRTLVTTFGRDFAVELTRSGGPRNIWDGGVHDDQQQVETSLPSGIPPTGGRPLSCGTIDH